MYHNFFIYSSGFVVVLSVYWIYHNVAPVLFFVFFFGHNACGILAPQPGIEPSPLHWEVKI